MPISGASDFLLGEEGTIVILSLVRNSGTAQTARRGGIGFLKVSDVSGVYNHVTKVAVVSDSPTIEPMLPCLVRGMGSTSWETLTISAHRVECGKGLYRS